MVETKKGLKKSLISYAKILTLGTSILMGFFILPSLHNTHTQAAVNENAQGSLQKAIILTPHFMECTFSAEVSWNVEGSEAAYLEIKNIGSHKNLLPVSPLAKSLIIPNLEPNSDYTLELIDATTSKVLDSLPLHTKDLVCSLTFTNYGE